LWLQLNSADAYQERGNLAPAHRDGSLRSDLSESLGNLLGTLGCGLLQFLFEQIYMQEESSERVADFMGYTRRQAAEQGKVLSALGFAFQALTFGHFVAQSSGTFLHALFELSVGELDRLFDLLTYGDIREGENATNNVASGVQ
jgi:hypothetical protein